MEVNERECPEKWRRRPVLPFPTAAANFASGASPPEKPRRDEKGEVGGEIGPVRSRSSDWDHD